MCTREKLCVGSVRFCSVKAARPAVPAAVRAAAARLRPITVRAPATHPAAAHLHPITACVPAIRPAAVRLRPVTVRAPAILLAGAEHMWKCARAGMAVPIRAPAAIAAGSGVTGTAVSAATRPTIAASMRCAAARISAAVAKIGAAAAEIAAATIKRKRERLSRSLICDIWLFLPA